MNKILTLILCFPLIVYGQRLSELNTLTNLFATNIVPVVVSPLVEGGTRKATLEQLRNFSIQPAFNDSNTFTLVFIPDTQYLSFTNAPYPNQFNTMVNAITNDVKTRNIKAALHVGDIVDTPNHGGQWTNAYENLKRIRIAGIPHLLAAGNHDTDNTATYSSTNYNTYFGQNYYTSESWWYGGFASNSLADNAYLLQTNGQYRWLYMILEIFPRTNVLNWASNILQTYSNHSAIVVSHSFINANDTRTAASDIYGKGNYGYPGGTDAHETWRFLHQHRNLVMVLSGHQITASDDHNSASFTGGNSGHVVSYGRWGNAVHQFLFNRQNLHQSGIAFFRWLTIKPDENRVDVVTYDPLTDVTLHDEANEFSFSIWNDLNLAHTLTLEGKSTNRPPQIFFDHYNDGLFAERWFLGRNGTNGNFELKHSKHQSHTNSTTLISVSTNGDVKGRTIGKLPGAQGFDSINNDLRLWLRYDEGHGTNVYDSSPYNHVNNRFMAWDTSPLPAYGSGTNAKSGYGMYFTRTNTVTFSGSTETLRTFGSNLTVATFFKSTNTVNNEDIFLSKHLGGTDGEWMLRISTSPKSLIGVVIANDVRVNVYGKIGTNVLNDNVWHHAALTYDGNYVRLYIDGKFAAATNLTGNIDVTAHDVVIAGYLGDVNFSEINTYGGWLDDTRVYARTLLPEEISILASSNPRVNGEWIGVTNAVFSTGNYTNTPEDRIVLIPSGSVRTNTLFNAEGKQGRLISIIDSIGHAAGTNIYVITQTGQTINGNPSIILTNDYNTLELLVVGTNFIINNYR